MDTIDYKGTTLSRWQCGPSTFLALPEKGARLVNWHLRMPDGSIRDVIHWPEEASMTPLAKVRGGNPILFPFAGRTYDKGTAGHWKDPQGKRLPMPRNGFARDGVFELTQTTAYGFTAEFRPDARAAQAYPFDYLFSVRYEFSDLAMRIYLSLENRGETSLPWSAGHHFYFALPWHEGLTRNDYTFTIPAKKCFTQAPDGTLLPVEKGWETDCSFGSPELSDRIYTKLKGGQVTFGPRSGEEQIGIRLLDSADTYSGWNAFVLWAEKTDSPYYCIEPWMGPPNAAGHGNGLHHVPPGDSSTFAVEVALL